MISCPFCGKDIDAPDSFFGYVFCSEECKTRHEKESRDYFNKCGISDYLDSIGVKHEN